MVRFKVIKGSHLLLGAAAVILAAVVIAILISFFMQDKPANVSTQGSLVEHMESEAKTNMVFASLNAGSGVLELDPEAGGPLSIEIIPSDPTGIDGDMPSVLIYHTHTHEAYEQVSGDHYVAIEAWRTMDQDHSVVRVGEELASLLRARGFEVVHDTTDHEQNDLGTAYTRSLDTLERYTRSFDLYIDLHRDAYIEGVSQLNLSDGGETYAQIMLLIGNGEGFDVKPYYPQNLKFAEALTQRVNAIKPGICKDVLVKDGRYNQNIGVFSILVEIGHNRNTLAEALRTLPYLADGIGSLMIDHPDDALTTMQEEYYSSNS